MPNSKTPPTRPVHSLPAYKCSDFIVIDGANLGDEMSFAAELQPNDIYELSVDLPPIRLSFYATTETKYQVADDSEIGTTSAILHLDSALTLMSASGHTVDAVILVEVDETGHINDIYLLPLSPLSFRTGYSLVGINTKTPAQTLAQVACVSFSRGTHITLASGEQRPIEDLKIGDRILTRNNGPQLLRWIGQSTVRATGELAPICIKAGTLNNDHDLILSPDHRLFIYQRSDALGAGRSELLVKARHLLNGTTIVTQTGGFVDYFQLLFDSHEIIYAEGIAAESMLIDTRTKSVLPPDLSKRLGDVMTGHANPPHAGLDVQEKLLNRPDAAEVLRRASSS